MILSCGEALIDMLPRETVAGEAAFAPYAGGALFNTAIAIGRLGVPSGFLCGLSTDLFGDQLREVLHAANVDTSPSVLSGRPTTMAWVRLKNGHATYTFYDEGTALRMLSPADLPDLSPDVAALVFGCISLVGEPCGSAYEALQAREAPTRVTVLDPNIRRGFIDAMGNAEDLRARLDRMTALADIWKASDEDLAWVMGPGDPETHARAILARGPRLVLVTLGGDGALAVSANGSFRIAAPKVTVADTVGAGDTFTAGVLTALYRAGLLTKPAIATLSEAAIRDAVGLGVRAAAVTVSRAGANPPWAHELA
jgi:fructokinase